MTRSLFSVFFGITLLFTRAASSTDCSAQWDGLLDTNPTHPKGIAGDTHAAYGTFSFLSQGNERFILKGNFAKARFMSLETDYGELKHRIDSLVDYEIEPDPGSENPFRPGVVLDTDRRAYTIEILPHGVPSTERNVLRLSKDRILAIVYRAFSPHNGVTIAPEDLPRVYAYDARTGQPAACPKHHFIPVIWSIPEFFTMIVPKKWNFSFKEGQLDLGTNVAIPKYMWAANPIRKGSEVLEIRFRPPTYTNLQSGTGPFSDPNQVRYWSLCVLSWPKNLTFNCVNDHRTKLDEAGFATIVFGKGDDVAKTAESRGQTFLEDLRTTQRVAGFVYRNLMPKEDFLESEMYQGEYQPKATMCSKRTYLLSGCRNR